MQNNSTLVVIPARWASSRFPGKPLHPLAGRSMLQHVFQRARAALPAARIIVATDDERIQTAARDFGAEVFMTRADHPSGTDRCAEVLELISQAGHNRPELVINVQGDEPLLPPENVRSLAQLMHSRPDIGMGTLACACSPEELADPAVVKVVARTDGRALYFSRAPIPHDRDAAGQGSRPRKHIGIYAYRPEILQRLVALPQSPLERTEKLEQLRALENGIEIIVGEGLPSFGVDTPGQVAAVEAALLTSDSSVYS